MTKSLISPPRSRIIDYSDGFLYDDNKLICIFTPFGRNNP